MMINGRSLVCPDCSCKWEQSIKLALNAMPSAAELVGTKRAKAHSPEQSEATPWVNTNIKTLIPQNHYKLYFLSTWATKSCSGFCHVRNFTYLSVANQKQAKLWYDMAKVAIKSEKLTPFGGIFSIMEQFDSRFSSVIDSTLGLRCKQYGYQYSEIIRWKWHWVGT